MTNHMYFGYTGAEVEALFKSLYPRLWMYASHLMDSNQSVNSADDIIQAVFCKFISTKPRILASKAPSYIFSMIHNECLSILRRGKWPFERVSLDTLSSSETYEALLAIDLGADEDISPVSKILMEDVLAFAKELHERTSEIFRMRRLKGKAKN